MWKKSLNLLLALALVTGLALPARADVTEAPEIPVDAETFPDETFRGLVLEICDENGDGSLSPEEAGVVTVLDVSNLGIGSLAGLGAFENLQTLECQGNGLMELDLTGNPALEVLRCYRNALTTLDVSGCPALRELYCGQNQLTTLNLSKNTGLSLLQCQENRLTGLDVSACPDLDFLVCSDNALAYLDLTANPKVTEVQVEGNTAMPGTLDLAAIPGFDPARASQWQEARVEGSTLIPEARAERLSFTYDLGGGRNAVFTWLLPAREGVPIDEQHFPDEGFRLVVSHDLDRTPDGLLTPNEIASVTRIQADHYKISSLEGLNYFTGLRELSCGGNNLAYVDVSELPLLTDLSGDDNVAVMEGTWDKKLNLAAIPGFDPARASNWEGGVLEGTVLTASADTLRFTYDADGPAGDKTLVMTWQLTFSPKPEGTPIDETVFPDETLRAYVLANWDPDGNGVLSMEEISAVTVLEIPGVQSLAGAELFSNLRTLNCENGGLTDLNPGLWPRLETLHCSFNRVANLDLSKTSRLETLSCAHNALSALDLRSCPELKSLDCRDNRLEVLDLSRNNRLADLSCGGNRLEALDLRKCPALTRLNCDYNRLTALALPDSGSLEMLSCNFNCLTQLDISGQKNLTWLFLGGNQLTELPLSHDRLEKLDCSNNNVTSLDISACPMLRQLNSEGNPLNGVPAAAEEAPPEEAAEETVPPETQPAAEETCMDGHTFGPWIDRIQPTCSQTGTRAHRDCTVCGRHFDKDGREISDLELPKEPASHRRTQTVPRVEPTCTEDGFTAGVLCQDCGSYISGHTRLPARHTLTPWMREVRPTADHPGTLAHFDCKICGRHFDSQGRELDDLTIDGCN